MTSTANPLPVVHADSGDTNRGAASRVVQTVKSAVRAQESELKRWRRTFDVNAKTVVSGEKYVPSVARSSPKLTCACGRGAVADSWTVTSL